MKTILLSVFFVAGLIYPAKATYPPAAWPTGNVQALSTLDIKSQGSLYFSVAIDGQLFPNPVKHFSLASIQPGMHRVELFTEVRQGYQMTRQRIYAGDIQIDPGALVTAVVDQMGRFYVKSVKYLPAYTTPIYEPYPVYPQVPAYPTCAKPAPMPMQAPAFTQLLTVMDNQWFESGKLQVAQQALATNYFTTAQVVDMMERFWFEETKLELAKQAYDRVLDPQVYFMVNDVFWFSSSVDELNQFLTRR